MPHLTAHRGDLDQGPSGRHLEGHGIRGPLEPADQGADVAERILDGVERPDPAAQLVVRRPEQLLPDVEGDRPVAGDVGGRGEQGDGVVERRPPERVAAVGGRPLLGGQREGVGHLGVAGLRPHEVHECPDDGSGHAGQRCAGVLHVVDIEHHGPHPIFLGRDAGKRQSLLPVFFVLRHAVL